jgi:hypothetical protein
MKLAVTAATAVILLSMQGTPVFAAPSSAQIAKAEAELTKRFDKADANQDGQVTRDEVNGVMPRVYSNFDKIDTAHKGAVTLDDIKAYVLEQLHQRS